MCEIWEKRQDERARDWGKDVADCESLADGTHGLEILISSTGLICIGKAKMGEILQIFCRADDDIYEKMRGVLKVQRRLRETVVRGESLHEIWHKKMNTEF